METPIAMWGDAPDQVAAYVSTGRTRLLEDERVVELEENTGPLGQFCKRQIPGYYPEWLTLAGARKHREKQKNKAPKDIGRGQEKVPDIFPEPIE